MGCGVLDESTHHDWAVAPVVTFSLTDSLLLPLPRPPNLSSVNPLFGVCCTFPLHLFSQFESLHRHFYHNSGSLFFSPPFLSPWQRGCRCRFVFARVGPLAIFAQAESVMSNAAARRRRQPMCIYFIEPHLHRWVNCLTNQSWWKSTTHPSVLSTGCRMWDETKQRHRNWQFWVKFFTNMNTDDFFLQFNQFVRSLKKKNAEVGKLWIESSEMWQETFFCRISLNKCSC